VLISHASKIRLLRQFVLVRKIFEDSQEQILSPMMGKTDFTVKNSVEFCEQMKNVSLREDGFL